MNSIVHQITVLAIATLGLVTSPQAQTSSPDEINIRDIFKRIEKAMTDCEPAAIGAVYTADGDRYSGGKYARGRADVGKMYEEACPYTKGGKNRFDISAVRFLRPEVALVDGTWFNDATGAKAAFTVVATKETAGWLIAAGRPR